MILVTWDIFRYELPLVVPLVMAGRELLSRTGLLIRIGDDRGSYGYGDVAPLPGLHREDFAAVLQQCRNVRTRLMGSELSPALSSLHGAFEHWLESYRLYPSLRCGVEAAVLDLLAAVAGTSVAGLLAPMYSKTVFLNGLLAGGEPESVERQAQHLAEAGYTALKLKVGRQSLSEDIARVRAARRGFGNTGSLRLDANRNWDLKSAVIFGRACADCRIDYIEEPLEDTSLVPEFYAHTGIPVAFDESLVGQSPEAVAFPEGVTTLVLKPSVLGGLEKTARWIRRARRCRLKTVVSSAFESGVGLAALANFAAALCEDGIPMGLDTYRWLDEDLFAGKFAMLNGRVDVDAVHGQARWPRPGLLARVD